MQLSFGAHRGAPVAGRNGWRNWAGNQTASPLIVERPTSEAEIIRAVERASQSRRQVRAIGSGHSFSGAAISNQTLIDLSHYNTLLHADRATGLVTVQAGITLSQLNVQLDQLGLALPNLGDISYQTLSGAISTGTHGTGAKLGGLATQVRELRLITAAEGVTTLTDDELKLAAVGLGAFGIISTLTIQCVPAFNLHVVNAPMKVDKVLSQFDELAATNDHFEFYWVPHTRWALTKQNNRTDQVLKPRGRAAEFANDMLFENVAFGALTKVGKRVPSLIPRLATAAPSSGRVEFIDKSFRVFVSPRLVKFVEQEYALPREATGEALSSIIAMVDRKGYNVSFPVEVRVAAADDIALSTAFERSSGYIAVHMVKGSDHRAYFRDVEDILLSFDGRPHWGKLHTRTYDYLASRYRRMDEVNTLRKRLDPNGLCANDYVNSLLGALN